MKKNILLIAFVCISIMANAQWQLTGNAGTNPATDFVGTTDGAPLTFRILGNQAGKLSFPLTSFGANSGLNITTGISNSFYGVASGQSTSSGSNNCFFGDDAGNLNTTGGSNNYFGKSAGRSNVTGISNCFFGSSAGLNNTASNNSFFGHISGASNTTGAFNSFFGVSSGSVNTTGNSNSFFGANSGTSNTSGIENVFFGFQSGQNSSTGISNSAIGSRAGNNNTTGSLNTFIGSSADCSTGNLFNSTAIGAGAIVSASNSMVLGNNANVGIGVSAPLDKLHVAGNIRMVDGNQAVGKVLTSDASGKATWQVIPPTVPTGAANGDLSGTYPNPVVDGLQGVAVSSTAPTSGQVLTYNGTQWNAAAPASVSPIGTANGDLTGTYPNPTVDGLQGVSVSSTAPAAGQVLQYNGATWTPAALPTESNDWKLNGNTGTSGSTNFIGTKDNATLSFRVNDTLAGNINHSFRNVFLGYKAGLAITVGNGNTFIGDRSGMNSTGINNTFMGKESGTLNTSGVQSVYIGAYAGTSNTTGNQNTYFGFNSGKASNGNSNTFLGESAAIAHTSGDNNVMIGKSAASALTTGDENVIIGKGAASSLTSGSSNTVIGEGTLTGSSRTNGIVIGNGAVVTLDNCAVIGNSSVTKIGIGKTPTSSNILEFQVTTAKLTTGGVWTNASDRKLKDNITQLDKKEVLEKINNLEIARWHYKADAEMRTHIGPFAKEFYAAFKTGDDSTISTIDPAGVALIAIQALSEKNNELKAEDGRQKAEIEELKSEVRSQRSELVKQNSGTHDGMVRVAVSEEANEALLGQNLPNPFDNSTIIPFRIPKECHSATIIIAESTGKIVRAIPVSCKETQLSLEAGALVHGVYSYSLMVDGVAVDTKQMILVK